MSGDGLMAHPHSILIEGEACGNAASSSFFFGGEFKYCHLRGNDMSHYTEVKSAFSIEHRDELIATCKELWPEATVLVADEGKHVKCRGWPDQTPRNCDIVVRFRRPTEEKQGNYDIGFVKRADGSYAMISDWYACTYPEATNDKGRTGSAAVEGMLKPIYTRRLMKKTLKKKKSLKGFKDISKKGDVITRKNKDGKEIRYARLKFRRAGL